MAYYFFSIFNLHFTCTKISEFGILFFYQMKICSAFLLFLSSCFLCQDFFINFYSSTCVYLFSSPWHRGESLVPCSQYYNFCINNFSFKFKHPFFENSKFKCEKIQIWGFSHSIIKFQDFKWAFYRPTRENSELSLPQTELPFSVNSVMKTASSRSIRGGSKAMDLWILSPGGMIQDLSKLSFLHTYI